MFETLILHIYFIEPTTVALKASTGQGGVKICPGSRAAPGVLKKMRVVLAR
jgi:hypothetical protein